MPILLLGLIFFIGLLVYYWFSGTSIEEDDQQPGVKEDEDNPFDQEENVIFLPDDIESMKEKYKNKR